MRPPQISTASLLLICMLCLFLSACREEVRPMVKPSEFTKLKREQLGDRLRVAIAQDPENFPVLPKMPPYDTTVYWYVQSFYNQLNSEIRLDRNSPLTDQWNSNRQWEVTILDMEEINAFIIPGGHFYITTGMLRKMNKEYELFYILAFELALMKDRVLLDQLFIEYTTSALSELAASGRSGSDDVSIPDLAKAVAHLQIDSEIVTQIDQKTAELICQSSAMDRTGLFPFLNFTDTSIEWFINRSNYIGREDFIKNEILVEGADCGSFKTNGGFRNFVLTYL